MQVPLDLSSAIWHFKRAARKADGSPHSDWQPHHETTELSTAATGIQKHLGSLDPRLDAWIPTAQSVPNEPLLLLQDLRIIPDPAFGLNEDVVQWVGETDWVFRCIFKTPEELVDGQALDLLVDRLDTFAKLWLNDKKIHASQNGFISYRISMTEHARKKAGDGNVLMFHFASAFREGRKLELQHGKRACWNGDSSRVYIRKPQYHYGWDWGPTLLTCGIVGVPRLHSYSHRLDDITIKTFNSWENQMLISTSVLGPNGPLSLTQFQNDGSSDQKLQLTVEIEHENKSWEYIYGTQSDANIFKAVTDGCDRKVSNESDRFCTLVTLPDIEVWGLGDQARKALYTVRLTLLCVRAAVEVILDTVERRTGFRKIELVQESFKSQPGSSFYFSINDKPVFCAGSNWIPASSYPSKVRKEEYRELLTMLVKGGQNSIRVWGGGFYEHDDLYDLCNELGILVWQDFMFACAAYPADLPAFRENVEKEAIHAVKRLAHHPCIALFAGNNEDYQVAEAEKLEWDPKNDNPEDWLRSTFPARYIYEKMLPEIVQKYSHIAYHPGSPWKTGSDTRDPNKGDIHQWNVWHGSQEDYQDWDKLGGRFVSEFGMHALPDRRTIDSFRGSDAQNKHPQSRVMEMHDKATDGITRLSQYMIKNLKYTMEIDGYIHASQLMQAECLSIAYQVWRREWRGDGKRYCGGALVWQLNDVYPAISWSIVDFYRRPKLAYFAIKRVVQPLTINLNRVKKVRQPDPLSAITVDDTCLNLWTANSTTESYTAKIEISTVEIATGKSETTSMPHVVNANSSTETDAIKMEQATEQDVVVVARLYIEEEIVGQTFSWPDPLRFIKSNNAKVAFDFDEDCILTVQTDRPVKGVTFSFDSDVVLEDNGFDMVPGHQRRIKVSRREVGKSDGKINRPTCRWYNQM